VTRKHLPVLVAAALGLLVSATAAGAHGGPFQKVRAATAAYRDLSAAQGAGYALLKDAAGISCIDNPGVGGMGIHYANGKLVGDGAVNATTPDVLVYQPLSKGRMRLVALEYVVFQAAWDAANHAPPSLFGRQFALLPAGNRYGLPAFYELHAWIWKHNPRGMFNDWNPLVRCPAA
jgi:hypothetical protein